MAFKFEKLDIWKLGMELGEKINEISKAFPNHELYNLSSQMRRAADSIALNIAEGTTGQSDAETYKFLGYSIRSGCEVVTCLFKAKMRGYISQTVFDELYQASSTVIAKTQAYRTYLNKQKA